MAMVVRIVNITDAPESKQSPTRIAIYTAHLDPGEELRLPASMVDTRLRELEERGFIAVDQVPSWYETSKAKRLGRQQLTREELEKLVVKPKTQPAVIADEVKVEDAAKADAKKKAKPEDAAEAKDKGTDKK